jgi:GlpG protein
MRLIWSTDHIDLLRKFSTFLAAKGIEHSIEEVVERNWGSENFGNKNFHLWIQDEDDVDAVKKYLEAFLQNPNDSQFAPNESKDLDVQLPRIAFSPTKRFVEQKLKNQLKPEKIELKTYQRPKFRLTNFLIAICCTILLLEMWTSKEDKEIPLVVQKEIITTAPVTKALLFDYPEKYELIDKIAALYGYQALAKPQDLPAPGKFLYEKYLKTESFEGLYPLFVNWGLELRGVKPKEEIVETPLFEKIREGEFWRLVTPIFLHADILHLFFNMIWLLILGLQLEDRLGRLRYILFTILVAIFSNISQYLVSGPAFIGYSGVICGMVFFIRARQKIAPWEGYQMSSATFIFIVFFIGTLALLSTLNFALDVFQFHSFLVGIANTAHLTGALAGYLLGQLKFFSWHGKDDFT